MATTIDKIITDIKTSGNAYVVRGDRGQKLLTLSWSPRQRRLARKKCWTQSTTRTRRWIMTTTPLHQQAREYGTTIEVARGLALRGRIDSLAAADIRERWDYRAAGLRVHDARAWLHHVHDFDSSLSGDLK